MANKLLEKFNVKDKIAVVIGGASLSGGQGSIPGAFLGTVFMALVSNALVIAHVSPYWQSIVIALILLTAVIIDIMIKKSKFLS